MGGPLRDDTDREDWQYFVDMETGREYARNKVTGEELVLNEDENMCMGQTDGEDCVGEARARPAIRLTNASFAYCERHWQQYLETANWDGVHEQQRRLVFREKEE
jgi:hypothetical protein